MEQLQIFNSSDFGQVRAIMVKGVPMFVANDIAKILGYADAQQAIRTHCKSGDTSKLQVAYIPHTNGYGGTRLKLIDESNVNRLIMQSKLPAAEKLKDWVCEEVLPSIRKTGGYLIIKSGDTPETILERATKVYESAISNLRKELSKSEVENKQKDVLLAQLQPIVEYAHEALDYGTSYSTNQIAKGLGLNGRKLNKRLKALGVQYKQGNTWLLYAKYENCDFTKLVPVLIETRKGTTYSIVKSKWTETGRAFIHQLNREGKI